jgi:predicted protein tyrosine phosphatase
MQAADEILPGLWLGNIVASQSAEFLKEKKIQSVFNCTKNIPFHESVRTQYRLPVDDNLQEEEIRNMELWSFDAVYTLRMEHKRGPVLVHCHAGMQRSACVVAMYLVAQGMKVEEAIEFIQKKRSVAFTPAPNFIKSMMGFERRYDKEVRPIIDKARVSTR